MFIFVLAPLVAVIFTVQKFPEPLKNFGKSDGLGGRDYGGDPAQDPILSTQKMRGGDVDEMIDFERGK